MSSLKHLIYSKREKQHMAKAVLINKLKKNILCFSVMEINL